MQLSMVPHEIFNGAIETFSKKSASSQRKEALSASYKKHIMISLTKLTTQFIFTPHETKSITEIRYLMPRETLIALFHSSPPQRHTSLRGKISLVVFLP
ncbi:hypothetical protein CEXT_69801 [Caerostris extrusa]|uniref:Uncharacterized protein n=1 Tax=Caerostris extrusa TaxID=172846 RepID=A0AAV4NXY2_CAEEX|nr:hypothetical protein CEXT_69801 [Caerostris extrusa]